jgi:sugar diacid utilization regulator
MVNTFDMDSEGSSELRSWLAAISTLTSAVNAGQSLKDLLDLVAATAQALLNLDFCGVMVPDADHEYLLIAGRSGLSREYAAQGNSEWQVPLEAGASDGAPASRAFRSGLPCAVADIAAEPDVIWTGVAREQGFRSVLSVPLVTAGGIIGTLNSYRSSVHDFLPAEVEQLQLLAEHAAIALTSARTLDDLREQHMLMLRSEQIHQRLLSVAVQAGGVPGIAVALHDLLDCDVVVSDARGEVLATGGDPAWPGEPDWLPPPSAQNPAEPHGLVREKGRHVVTDVLLDGSIVAAVWLLGRAGNLMPLDVRAAQHASVVLSLEILRQRTAVEVEQKLRGELLADLLAGADLGSASVRDRASLLGHDLTRPHRVLIAEAADQGSVLPERLIQRAAAEAVRMAADVRPRPLIAARQGILVALWPEDTPGPAGTDVLRRGMSAAQPEAVTTVAVSAPVTSNIPAAYRIAEGALALAALGKRHGGVVNLDDLGVAGLLLQFAEPGELRRYAERTIGPLARYDREHRADLVKTLRAYLDSGLDRIAAGHSLVVHPNTVSQRLRRIMTLTGLDVRSPQSVIDARAALILLDVADASRAALAQPGGS